MRVVGHDLVKQYGEQSALAGVSVAVEAGRLTAVTGPSGSGKTTLLHLLAGLLAPDGGTVEVDGVALSSLGADARAALRRTRMGFVFQRDNLLPALTVTENVALPLLLQGQRGAAVRRTCGEALERLGLGGRGEALPTQLSGGEQQRVALARLLMQRPDVVWADEPTGALDSAAGTRVLDLLREVVDQGSAVVVVTHDPQVAARADVVIGLRDGVRVP